MSDVWLDASARELIAEEAATRRVRETGGPVFGYESKDGLIVAHAFGPGPKARHRRTRLVMDPVDVQTRITQIFDRYDGRLAYLGDWHSHPRGAAHPSRVDITSAAIMADDAEAGVPRPLVLIQATRPFRVHVGISELRAFHWDPANRNLPPASLRVATLDLDGLTD